MPRGKISVRGYILSSAKPPEELTFETWLKIVMKYKKRGFEHGLSDSELRKFYMQMIASISKYKGTASVQKSANLQVIMTYTEFKKELLKIQNAARKVLSAKTEKSRRVWMDKLSEYTRANTWTLAVKDFLHRRLNKVSYSASDIQKFFNKKNVTPHDKQDIYEILRVISLDEVGWKQCIQKNYPSKDEQQIVLRTTALPNESGFADPLLVRVIKQTAESWIKITGRTLKYIPRTGKFYDQKQHPFAEYLDALFFYFGLDELPNGRVNDIVTRIF